MSLFPLASDCTFSFCLWTMWQFFLLKLLVTLIQFCFVIFLFLQDFLLLLWHFLFTRNTNKQLILRFLMLYLLGANWNLIYQKRFLELKRMTEGWLASQFFFPNKAFLIYSPIFEEALCKRVPLFAMWDFLCNPACISSWMWTGLC